MECKMYSLDLTSKMNFISNKEDNEEGKLYLATSSLNLDNLENLDNLKENQLKLEEKFFLDDKNENLDHLNKLKNETEFNESKLISKTLLDCDELKPNLNEKILNETKNEKYILSNVDTSNIIYDSIIVSFSDENLKQNENLDYLKYNDSIHRDQDVMNGQENNEIILDLMNVANLNNGNHESELTDLMVLEEKPINQQWPINLPQNSINSTDSWFYFDKHFMNNEEQFLNNCSSIEIQTETNISSSNADLVFKFEEEEQKTCNELNTHLLNVNLNLQNSNNIYHSHLLSTNVNPFDFHIHHHSILNSDNRHLSSMFTSNLINSSQQQMHAFHNHAHRHHSHLHHNSTLKNEYFNTNNMNFSETYENTASFQDQHQNSSSANLIPQQFNMFENEFIYTDQQQLSNSFKVYSCSANDQPRAQIELNNCEKTTSDTKNLITNNSQILQKSNTNNMDFENELHQAEQSILMQQQTQNNLYEAQFNNSQYILQSAKQQKQLDNQIKPLQNNPQIKNSEEVLQVVNTNVKFSDDCKQMLNTSSIKLNSGKKLISLKEAANVKLEKVKIERANGMKIYYFKCSLCSYQTNTSQSMKDHLYCIHCKAKNNYKCNICHQTFGWKNNAQRHMRRKHKIEDQTTKREAIITLI